MLRSSLAAAFSAVLAAGAQHIGGADAAGADRADVFRAGGTRENESKRDGAEQIPDEKRRDGGQRRLHHASAPNPNFAHVVRHGWLRTSGSKGALEP